MSQNRSLPKSATGQQALARALAAAVAAIEAGRLDEAAKTLQANRQALKTPVGLNILGDIRLRQGNPRDALKAFDAAVKLAPSQPEAHSNRSVALQETGRLTEALAAADRALHYRPDHATAHFNRGNILKDLGRPDEALAAYDRALQANPDLAEAHLNRGTLLSDKGRLDEALADFRRAQGVTPAMVAAHLGEAGAHRALGHKREALAAVDAALAIEPANAEALVFKARYLIALERYPAALAAADRLLESEPENVAALSARASALRKLKRFDEALAVADAAIRVAPNDPEGYAARAMALSEVGRAEEQLDMLETARRLGAASADFYHAQANALAEFGDLTEARAAFERAVALDPDDAALRYHYGMLLLYLGDTERGWAEHEWRLRDPDFKQAHLARIAPAWEGNDLDGKAILVYGEQGLGDTIQFARFLPDVAARGGRVAFQVPPVLANMMRRSLPGVEVVDNRNARKSGFDYQVSAMSLPHVLRTGAETRAGRVPYLAADQARVDKWRARLGSDGFKVGIAWQGNPGYYRDRYRSVPLRRFQPLAAVPGVRLISVQAINGLDQLDDLPAGMTVERFGAEIANNPDGVDEVAGLMANLDLIVTSDSSPAHLAGALGLPVWVALWQRPDWRWQDRGISSPWYPTMRLFRQSRRDDWDAVFEAIAAALGERVG